jgi:hypothetical protein
VTAYQSRGTLIRLQTVRRPPRSVSLLLPHWGLGYRSWNTGTDGSKKPVCRRCTAQRRFFANTRDCVMIACSRSKSISRLFAQFAKAKNSVRFDSRARVSKQTGVFTCEYEDAEPTLLLRPAPLPYQLSRQG